MAHFLKFEDSKIGDRLVGETARDNYKDQIEVLAWTWGVVQPRLESRPHRSTPARAEFAPLQFEHRAASKASPGLVFAAADGVLIDSATLTSVSDEGPGVEYSKVAMEDVYIASAEQSAGAFGEGSESVALTFRRAIYSVWEINQDGSRGEVKKVTLDLEAGKHS